MTVAEWAIFDDPHNPSQFLLDDPGSIASIQWLADLSATHHVMPTPAEVADIGDLFAAGKTGMKIIGHWRVPTYVEGISDFGWNVAPVPQGKIAANRADGSAYAITEQSQHKEEAWEFVKFLAGPGSAGVEKLIELHQMTPALVDARNAPSFLMPPDLPDLNAQAFLYGEENLFTMYGPDPPDV